MIKIDIQTDIDRALGKFARIPKEVEAKALPRTLNKTADQAKTKTSKEIVNIYCLKARSVKQALKVAKAYAGRNVATLIVQGHSIPLYEYGARQVKNGVTVNVKNGRKLIPGAFIARMPNGHTGVYVRRGPEHKKVDKGGRKIWSGLPIDELFGPSLPSAFWNKVVQENLDRSIRENFQRIFKHEVEFLGLK